MSDGKFFVYLLRRDDTNKVFYVGETNCPERRLGQHLDEDTPHTEEIIRELKRAGIGVRMQIVGTFDTRQEARQYEAELVDRAKRKPYRLANHFLFPTGSRRRNGKPWSEKERQQVRRMYEVENLSPTKIARMVERSCGSVAYQLKQQGVTIQW